MALTKIITDVIDDSIRIGSGSLATISGSSASTGSFGRVIVAEMGNSDLTSVSSSISTRITTNSGSFAAASSSYSSASGSLSTRVNLLEGSGSITESSASFSTRVNLLEGSGSINDLVTDSGSFSTRVNLLEGSGSINDLVTDSGSFSTRVNLLEGSGSITESSASFSTRVNLLEGSGSINDLVTASGSFSTRVSDLKTDSGSFSTRVTTTEASGALFDGDGVVTFAGATITGTLTAQEVHTEFISASVTVSTGSNIFGDETTDVHQFTGSIETSGSILLDTLGGNVSGSIVSTGSFGAANIAGMTVSNLIDVSSSLSSRLTDVKTESGSFAAASSSYSSASGSFSTRVSDLKTDSGSFAAASSSYSSASGSFSTRVSDLVTDSGSFSTRVSDLNLSLSGSTTLISGSATSTGSFGRLHVPGSDILIGNEARDASITFSSTNTYRMFSEANSDRKFKIHDVSDGVTRLTIDTAGRVGIGDDSPGSPLDVKSGEAANTANFNSTNGATNITLESNGSLIGQMEFSGAGPSGIVTRTTASLAFGSNNVKSVFITDDDKVGIGTDSPTSILTIASSTTPSLTFNDTGGGTDSKIFRLSGGGDKFFFEGRNDADSDDGDAGTMMTFDLTNGKIGIGDTAPSAPLEVSAGSGKGQGSFGYGGVMIAASSASAQEYDGGSSVTWGPKISIANETASSTRTGCGISFVHRDSSSGVAAIVSTNTATDRADLRFITRGAGNVVAERMKIEDDGIITTHEGIKYSGTDNAAPTGDDILDQPIKHALFEKAVDASDVSAGSIDFDVDIARTNVISINGTLYDSNLNVNHFGLSADETWLKEFTMFASGGVRVYFGSSVAATDIVKLIISFFGNTG